MQLIKARDFVGHLANLNEIPEPPEQLYLEGSLPSDQHLLLGVVGSRKHSSYGREVCEHLIGGLRGYPISIVSGLAIGMDTIAHKTALRARLHTVAMPGSGLDRKVLHPHSNRLLAEEIVKSGGCLLSEYDPEYPAGIHTFPERNRLMAGLVRAVLVIEAGERSGTLITARLATEYNRDVLVVPGSIFNPNSKGVNMLLRLGATPITCPDDLLQALHFEISNNKHDNNQAILNFKDYDENEQKVIELLSVEPLPRDELIRQLGIPTSEASTTLMQLEIKGVIKETLGEFRLM